ncbi:MAG TPA: chemotaxis protein CheD [Gemmatimonadales bacterium]
MSPAPEEHLVKVADWTVQQGQRVIVTLGLGSCVAIMLHDAGAGLGGMAHVLLPSRSLARDVTNPAKFPETAVPLLVERLVALGGSRPRLVAKLAGGAGMFATLLSPGTIQMGERNVVAARDALRRHAIPLVGESVGGDRGRSVRFYVQDGRVEIRSVGADAAII